MKNRETFVCNLYAHDRPEAFNIDVHVVYPLSLYEIQIFFEHNNYWEYKTPLSHHEWVTNTLTDEKVWYWDEVTGRDHKTLKKLSKNYSSQYPDICE